jgi:hypothetical protein
MLIGIGSGLVIVATLFDLFIRLRIFRIVGDRLKAIRSVSMTPSATHGTGHFYFAQTGHSHFAATKDPRFVDLFLGAL